jgi:hypothetical protein
MTTQVRLNRYERGIAGALEEHFGYTAEAARQIVVQYVNVVRKLGGYDSCFDQAERLHRAHEACHPPKKWLERIRILELDSKMAGQIPRREGPYAQVR